MSTIEIDDKVGEQIIYGVRLTGRGTASRDLWPDEDKDIDVHSLDRLTGYRSAETRAEVTTIVNLINRDVPNTVARIIMRTITVGEIVEAPLPTTPGSIIRATGTRSVTEPRLYVLNENGTYSPTTGSRTAEYGAFELVDVTVVFDAEGSL